ncbi:MAG TPA: hypothetical protein VMD76_11020, partial [Candidatus Sulfotelmatobacter sp.]|nr:hypothetical protein [Candidatus Sulfotelmatobacter sp.]
LPAAMKEVVTGTIVGSVEHTRNGYDANMRVYLAYGQLAVPAFSIAVSYLKTQVESETVAATILNAIESVLYSHGFDLRSRNVFLFGSRGNVGRRLMAQLRASLDTPDRTLIGCDLKVSRPDITTQLPPWQIRPSQSSACGASEVTTYAEVDNGRARFFDLILGVTGGPTPGHPVLQVNDVVTWLLDGETPELYIASGSTKTDEFPEVLAWMNSLLAASGEMGTVVNVDVGGHPAKFHKEDLIDVLSHRRFGSRYVFNIVQRDGTTRDRSLVFMQDLMPVNFLFYGCPTEIIDYVLAQLVSASLVLLRQVASLTQLRLYAVDFDPEASASVFASHPPAQGSRFPLPRPGES